MSLTAALQTGRSALAAGQTALQVVGNNMANAATEGFHRRSVVLAANSGQAINDRVSVGSGVNVSTVRREVDNALEARLRSAISDENSASIDDRFLGSIESILGELGDGDLSSMLSDFFNAFSEVANRPTDSGTRALVVQQGAAVAGRLTDLRGDLSRLRREVDDALSASVDRVNALLDDVASLNLEIARLGPGGGDTGAIADQLDQRLAEISQYLEISTVRHASGSVDVLVNSIPVVLPTGSRGVELRLEQGSAGQEVSLRVAADGSTLSASSGSIGALMRQREETVEPSIADLDLLAQQLVEQVNRLHVQGDPLVGTDSFVGATAIRDASVALNDEDSGLDFAVDAGHFFLHVVDVASGQSTAYRIDVDGATDSLADLMDEINVNVAVPNVTASLTSANRFALDAANGYEIRFSDDTSGALAALGINTFFSGRDASSISVNDAIRDDPGRLAVGDSGIAGSNGTALAIAALQDVPVDALGGATLRGFWNDATAELASRASSARAAAASSTIVREGLYAQAQSVSGVSLDEEAINLLSFQRQYQAAARFISVIDETLQVLLSIA